MNARLTAGLVRVDRSVVRQGAVVLGILLPLLALYANRVGLSSNPGFGGIKLLTLVIGVVVLLYGLLPERSSLRRWYSRLLLVAVSTYLALLLCECALSRTEKPTRNWRLGLKGMCRAAEKVGYDYTPGWKGTFDDGIVRGAIHINSLGARDDEPLPDESGVRKILLIGDSFTFGHGLDQSETIDKQIEEQSEHRIDAYNLGVGGYGPAEILERFRATTWWKGSDVFYLFYQNDLRKDNSTIAVNTVFDGYLVPNRKADGTRYTESEYRVLVKKQTEQTQYRPVSSFSFSQLKRILRLAGIRQRLAGVLGSDSALVDGKLSDYRQEYVQRAVDATMEMWRVASRRGCRFHVVIVPTKAEVIYSNYASFTKSYLDAVENAGIHVIETIEHLSADDYFVHDGHFNRSGARIMASIILAYLPQ